MDKQQNQGKGSNQPPFEATITLVTPKESKPSTEGKFLKAFEATVSLIKAVAWPIVVLVLFLMLRDPIDAILNELPAKATKIAIGTLSFEIEQTAKAVGNPELAEIIDGLSPPAIELLLRTAGESHTLVGSGAEPNVYVFPPEEKMNAIEELEEKGLLEFKIPRQEFLIFVESLDLEQEEEYSDGAKPYRTSRPLSTEEKDEIKEQKYFATDLGKKAFDLVVEVVVQQLQTPTSDNPNLDK